MKKPQLRNPFFIFPVIIILVNYFLLLSSYLIQNNTQGLQAWNTAILISEVSLCIIVLCFIARLIFIVRRKITVSEFLIGFILNITALYFWYVVIFDRI